MGIEAVSALALQIYRLHPDARDINVIEVNGCIVAGFKDPKMRNRLMLIYVDGQVYSDFSDIPAEVTNKLKHAL
jgi:hypothetical protein